MPRNQRATDNETTTHYRLASYTLRTMSTNYSATLCALAACRNQSALGSAYNDAIVALYMSETTGRFSFSVGPTDKHTM